MASTLPLQQIKYAGTVSGNQPLARTTMPNTGATIHAGDIVVLTGGLAAVSGTPVPASNTVLGVAMHGAKQGTGWYLVPEDNSGTLQQEDTGGTFGGTFMGSTQLLGSVEGLGVHYVVANQDTLFLITLVEAVGLDDIGVQVGIVQNSSIWQASTAQATKVAEIVAIPNFVGQNYVITGTVTPVNPIPTASGGTGDLNYPVIVRFLSTATILA